MTQLERELTTLTTRTDDPRVASDVARARRMLDAGLPGRAAYYRDRAASREKLERRTGNTLTRSR